MERRAFIIFSIGGCAVALSPLGGHMDTQGQPDPEYGSTQWVRDEARRLRRVDLSQGGDVDYDGAETTAKAVYNRAIEADKVGAEHWTAVGNYLSVVGFMGYDSQRYVRSNHWFNTAYQCARRAQNRSLQARVMGQRARSLITQKLPEMAIATLREALQLGELTATDMTMLYALLARAHGALTDTTETTVAYESARSYWLHDRTPYDNEGHPWTEHFDLSHLNGDLAAGLAPLVQMGEFPISTPVSLFEAAAKESRAPRSKALQLAAAASLECAVGDLERGVDIGHFAANVATGMHSPRVATHLNHLARVASIRGSNAPMVSELAQHIRYAAAS